MRVCANQVWETNDGRRVNTRRFIFSVLFLPSRENTVRMLCHSSLCPLPFLHRPRQTVAKKAIKIVVDVAGKVFEFLADIVEKAVAALNWVWNKIKVRFGFDGAVHWSPNGWPWLIG